MTPRRSIQSPLNRAMPLVLRRLVNRVVRPGHPARTRLFGHLLAAYAEPHRRYHTQQHLQECLGHLQGAWGPAEHPGEVALALWFHDAVYAPDRHDNEPQSADWRGRAVVAAGWAPAVADRIHALILATRHDAAPATPDEALLVDIDLAILGAAPGALTTTSARCERNTPRARGVGSAAGGR